MEIQEHDVVWYWRGGRERGVWFGVYDVTPTTIDDVADGLHADGYVTRKGVQSMGCPTDPPHADEFRAVEVRR